MRHHVDVFFQTGNFILPSPHSATTTSNHPYNRLSIPPTIADWRPDHLKLDLYENVNVNMIDALMGVLRAEDRLYGMAMFRLCKWHKVSAF